jgi:hypothetical protein
MSLIQITLPLRSFERLVLALERIAATYPPVGNQNVKEPTSGVTIVSNEMLLEEEVRTELRSKGFMPDDIEAMINGETETPTL